MSARAPLCTRLDRRAASTLRACALCGGAGHDRAACPWAIGQ